MEADRRLYYAADGKTLVEENDERAAFLAYPKGAKVSTADAKTLQEREAATQKPAKPEAKAEPVKAPQSPQEAPKPAPAATTEKAPAKGK